MRQAFQAVKRNRGAAGVDKISIQLFAANLEENLAALMRELKTGTFRPLPLRRVHIPKGPGSTKLRPLGIPVVRNRVAEEVARALNIPVSINRNRLEAMHAQDRLFTTPGEAPAEPSADWRLGRSLALPTSPAGSPSHAMAFRASSVHQRPKARSRGRPG